MSCSTPLVRRAWPAEPGKLVALHLGGGRAGACFGADGLMDAADQVGVVRTGRTLLMHADHWSRGVWGLDQQAPVARVHWAVPPDGAGRPYSQIYDTARGRLDTDFGTAGGRVRVAAGFSPVSRDVFALDFGFGGRPPALVVAPERRYTTCYDETLTGPPCSWNDLGGGLWSARVRLGTADSTLVVRVHGRAAVTRKAGRLEIAFTSERGGLLVGTGAWARREEVMHAVSAPASPAAFLDAAAPAWEKRFGTAGVSLPNSDLQGLFDRSHHHVLASFEPAPRCPAPPTGWTGNAWGFHFPQDTSYIHPALLRLGHFDLAKSVVEFYASRIAQMQEATRRLYRASGVLWAWEFPVGADTVILPDGKSPNPFHFELHNAAYPARMAAETARFTGDREWGRAFAWPVILESARFYASILKRGRDGLWGAHIKPSMGQDEFGGENAPDYLCLLFSAEYTLGIALKLARELSVKPPAAEANAWRAILRDGLAYPRLLRPDLGGVFATSAKPGYRLGRQKHPVQLNPLVFVPLRRLDAPTRRAYALRHALCENERVAMCHPGTRGSYYNGWTLAAYWLAAVRMGDADGLEHELRQTLVSQYADPEWLQLYESSGFWNPYYTTSMGLYLQTITDAFVTDWTGDTVLHSAVPLSWAGASYRNLRTADGKSHSARLPA